MSHIPQRKEKDCLNCGAIVQGRYCQNCGQENVVPHETFWHMVKHFLYDITHFDSNFFGTIHHLIFKPGFLSKEYVKGRRAGYLHPVKMYVFTSAIFFLLFFSFFITKDSIKTNLDETLSPALRLEYINNLQEQLKKDPGNSDLLARLMRAKDSAFTITVADTISAENNYFYLFGLSERSYRNRAEYDSLQQLLPEAERDDWFTRSMTRKEIEINQKYKGNPGEVFKKLADGLLHRLPYMLFVSLPLFALILKLVYFRRKQFYFADHGIFTIHLYVFTFLALLCIFLFGELSDLTGWYIWGILTIVMVLLLIFYLFVAMRNFYGQSKGKTALKFLLVLLASVIMILILFAFFAFFSAFTI